MSTIIPTLSGQLGNFGLSSPNDPNAIESVTEPPLLADTVTAARNLMSDWLGELFGGRRDQEAPPEDSGAAPKGDIGALGMSGQEMLFTLAIVGVIAALALSRRFAG